MSVRKSLEDEQGRPRPLRRLWPLAAFLAVCAVLLAVILIRQAAPPPSPRAATAAGARRPASSHSGRSQGGVPALRTVRASAASTAARVVRASLAWKKTEKGPRPVPARTLEQAGMSRAAAAAYKPVWPRVYSPARAGGLSVSDVSAQFSYPDRAEHVYIVTGTLHPWWTDRKGRRVETRPGRATWTVRIDPESGRVTGLTDPDPKWLYFALPEDGLMPQERPAQGGRSS